MSGPVLEDMTSYLFNPHSCGGEEACHLQDERGPGTLSKRPIHTHDIGLLGAREGSPLLLSQVLPTMGEASSFSVAALGAVMRQWPLHNSGREAWPVVR